MYTEKSPKQVQDTADKTGTSLKAFCCSVKEAIPKNPSILQLSSIRAIMKQETRWAWKAWELKILVKQGRGLDY